MDGVMSPTRGSNQGSDSAPSNLDQLSAERKAQMQGRFEEFAQADLYSSIQRYTGSEFNIEYLDGQTDQAWIVWQAAASSELLADRKETLRRLLERDCDLYSSKGLAELELCRELHDELAAEWGME
jgi:hypothetical protein